MSQLLARDLLTRHGALVTLAANGSEALAAASAGSFNIVLMDIRMPEMDGLTACRRIRALPSGGLPIIALTANALAGERERCLAAGMDGYLTKPLEPETLYAELCRWLRVADGEHQIPQPASGAAQPALPGFDPAKMRRWWDQAPDAWHAMVRVFVTEYPAAVAAVGAALDAGDRIRAKALLHRLRGAAGALGAEDLAAAAERLELALVGDGPIDAEARARFFARAEAALAVLKELETPSEDQVSAGGGGRGWGECSERLEELEALLEAGNTRALDHLPWLEGWVAADAPEQGRELLRNIEALDFPAALRALRALGKAAITTAR